MDWQEYQQKAADFFRSLGLSAEVEAKVEGARGVHKIDVYVEGTYHGIKFRCTRPHFTTIADFIASMDKEVIRLFLGGKGVKSLFLTKLNATRSCQGVKRDMVFYCFSVMSTV